MAIRVVLYTKDSSGECQAMRMFLKLKGIDYTEKNVTKDQANAVEFVKLNAGEQPPLLCIKKDEDDFWTLHRGYDPQVLTKIFGQLK